MNSSRRADQFTECPGPCNPQNRVCRRTCVENVMSILEELPPCIRSRLRQEDLFSIFANDQELEAAPVADDQLMKSIQNVCSKTARKWKEDSSPTIAARGRSDDGRTMRDQSTDDTSCLPRTMQEETTQTQEEKQIQTTEEIICEVTSRYRSISAGTDSLRQRIQDASILVRSIARRGIRVFPSASSCSCRLINTTIYVVLLLSLAIFARHSTTYQIFLSSQICGILAILSWRFSGTVPL